MHRCRSPSHTIGHGCSSLLHKAKPFKDISNDKDNIRLEGFNLFLHILLANLLCFDVTLGVIKCSCYEREFLGLNIYIYIYIYIHIYIYIYTYM